MKFLDTRKASDSEVLLLPERWTFISTLLISALNDSNLYFRMLVVLIVIEQQLDIAFIDFETIFAVSEIPAAFSVTCHKRKCNAISSFVFTRQLSLMPWLTHETY